MGFINAATTSGVTNGPLVWGPKTIVYGNDNKTSASATATVTDPTAGGSPLGGLPIYGQGGGINQQTLLLGAGALLLVILLVKRRR